MFLKTDKFWVEMGQNSSLSAEDKKIPTKYFSVKLFAQVIQETLFYKTPLSSMLQSHKSSEQRQQFSCVNF